MVAEMALMGCFGVDKRIGRSPMVDTEAESKEHHAGENIPFMNQKQKQI